MNKNLWKWSALGLIAGAGLVLLDAWYGEQYFFRVKKFDIGLKGA